MGARLAPFSYGGGSLGTNALGTAFADGVLTGRDLSRMDAKLGRGCGRATACAFYHNQEQVTADIHRYGLAPLLIDGGCALRGVLKPGDDGGGLARRERWIGWVERRIA